MTPDLAIGEGLIREDAASRLLRFYFGSSGWLSLTDRRLIFREGMRPQWLFEGRCFELGFLDIESATVGRWMMYSTLDLVGPLPSQRMRLTLARADLWARDLTAAIESARSGS